MAGQSSSLFKTRFLLAPTILFLFSPPIISILTFFWPLILSTVLGVLAVLSFGGLQGGNLTKQEEGVLENCTSDADVDTSSAARMEKINDVLMVGNQEVGWLEWLHNEDMEKCRMQDRARRLIHANWVSDDHGFEVEASANKSSLQAKKKCLVDAYDSVIVEEDSVNEVIKDEFPFSSMVTVDEDISVTTQVDNTRCVIARASSVSDLCKGDASSPIHQHVNVVEKNASPPLIAEDMAKQNTVADELLNVMLKQDYVQPEECAAVMNAMIMEAVTPKDVYSDSTEASSTCGRAYQLESTGEKIEKMVGLNYFDFAVYNGRKFGFADGAEVRTSVPGMASIAQEETLTRDEITREGITFQYGSLAAKELKASEHTLVDRDEGECLLLSLPNKVVNMVEMLETPPPKTFMQEQEVSIWQESERHMYEDDSKEKHTRENNGGPILKLTNDEENKSSLRFSFFHNGCLTLTQLKQEAGVMAPHS